MNADLDGTVRHSASRGRCKLANQQSMCSVGLAFLVLIQNRARWLLRAAQVALDSARALTRCSAKVHGISGGLGHIHEAKARIPFGIEMTATWSACKYVHAVPST